MTKLGYKFINMFQWDNPHYYVNEHNQLTLGFGDSNSIFYKENENIYICYTKGQEYDTLHKHGKKEIVEEAFKRMKVMNQILIATNEEVRMFEVPNKYFNEVNAIIHISATKRISKLEQLIEDENNLIEVEVCLH